MIAGLKPYPADKESGVPWLGGGGGRLIGRSARSGETCVRIRERPTFHLLVEAVRCRFKGTAPELRWITHHEPLLVCATP